jgi:PTS system cellobiose-specific IIC component
MIALYLSFSIGYHTAKVYGEKEFSVGLISMASFLLLIPSTVTATLEDAETGVSVSGLVSNVISTSYFGASGMFMAMIVGLIAAYIFIGLSKKGIKIKMPSSVPENVSNMFESMIPGGAVLLIFVIINNLVGKTSYGTVYALINGLLQKPLMAVGGGTAGFIVYTMVSIWFWMFGIHGGLVAYSAFSAVYVTARMENAAAFAAGVAAPYPLWATWPWYVIGGTGCTMGLVLLMLFRHKSSQTKALGRLALPCALFNINEPVIFGCPIIMNPYLALPFCLIPFVNLGLTVLMMKIGLVALPTGAAITAYLPIVLQPAMANASWTGAVWQIILIALDAVLYYPFYRAFDDNAARIEKENEAMANSTEE